jgi:hypothetical protein
MDSKSEILYAIGAVMILSGLWAVFKTIEYVLLPIL